MKKIASTALTLTLALSGTLATGAAHATTEPIAEQSNNTVLSVDNSETLKAELLQRINQLRADKGLSPLTLDTEIGKVAQDWTTFSTNRAGFAHNPNFDKQIPKGASYAGEIIATGDFMEEIVFGWEMSESHYKVITNKYATKIGIGLDFQDQRPNGEYYNQYYVTAIIADYTDRPIEIPPVPTPTPTPVPTPTPTPTPEPTTPPVVKPTPTPVPTPTHAPTPEPTTPPVVKPTPEPTTPPVVKPTPPAKSPFKDVATNNLFYKEISWLASSGISTGWADKTFRPYESVKRDAMAAFLYRQAGSPAYTPPKKSPFKDVATNNVFYKEIAWLASSGISTGWSDGTFRPYADVSRDAMSAFLYRAAGSPSYTPTKKSAFNDVATNNVFYKEISWLASSGISTGWADGTFRPYESVKRDTMAAFLYRATN